MSPRLPASPRLLDRVRETLTTASLTRAQIAARFGLSLAAVNTLLMRLRPLGLQQVREEERLAYRMVVAAAHPGDGWAPGTTPRVWHYLRGHVPLCAGPVPPSAIRRDRPPMPARGCSVCRVRLVRTQRREGSS